MKLAVVAALASGAAACNADDGGNVMASSGNSLTNAQVDAALGPEIAVADSNELGESGAGGTNEVGADTQTEPAPGDTGPDLPANDSDSEVSE